MIHETQADTGKWLELNPGDQRIIVIKTWYLDCRLIGDNNKNAGSFWSWLLMSNEYRWTIFFKFYYLLLTLNTGSVYMKPNVTIKGTDYSPQTLI